VDGGYPFLRSGIDQNDVSDPIMSYFKQMEPHEYSMVCSAEQPDGCNQQIERLLRWFEGGLLHVAVDIEILAHLFPLEVLQLQIVVH
jgi:hypothetical protein